MQDWWVDGGVGIVAGGLLLSAGWGWYWLAVSVTGYTRGTCSRLAGVNSLAVAVAPLLLAWVLVALAGWTRLSSGAFAAGACVMPAALLTLAARRAPDGQRAGWHMVEGVRQLRGELLGAHRGCGDCGGCGDAHPHEH